jgi:hypothetical protein
LVRQFEPVIRRELRFRASRERLRLDSMDICQSVLVNFFVRVATGQYDLKEPNDLVKLLLVMTRNKVTEKARNRYRQRRDTRRTVMQIVELPSEDPTPCTRYLQQKAAHFHIDARNPGKTPDARKHLRKPHQNAGRTPATAPAKLALTHA